MVERTLVSCRHAGSDAEGDVVDGCAVKVDRWERPKRSRAEMRVLMSEGWKKVIPFRGTAAGARRRGGNA